VGVLNASLKSIFGAQELNNPVLGLEKITYKGKF
jgi:hypothetical protein